MTDKGLFINDYIEFSINNMGTISCINKICLELRRKCFCRKILQKYLTLVSVRMRNAFLFKILKTCTK